MRLDTVPDGVALAIYDLSDQIGAITIPIALILMPVIAFGLRELSLSMMRQRRRKADKQ
jgi:hypothetical protein